MAIRFDAAYNADIRRVVRNFNQKRNRAIKRGFRNLPPPVKVSELKARYTKRADLNRELRLLKQFSEEDALEKVETSGGVTAIKWEVKYLKANIKKAKAFYDREIYKLTHLDTELAVTKREMLNNLKTKRSYLDLELDLLSPSQYGTYRATVGEYLSSNFDKQRAYRAWMNEVETIMRRLGYKSRAINQFFKGFDQLTPSQFMIMYQKSNLISRIYELYLPTREGDFKLSTTEDDARELIETFIAEKDDMIAEAKAQEDMLDDTVIRDFEKKVNSELPVIKKKLKKSDLTKKDIEMIEALGGTIEDLLK